MDGRLVINHLKNLKTRYCETENRIPKFKDLNVSWKWWCISFVPGLFHRGPLPPNTNKT